MSKSKNNYDSLHVVSEVKVLAFWANGKVSFVNNFAGLYNDHMFRFQGIGFKLVMSLIVFVIFPFEMELGSWTAVYHQKGVRLNYFKYLLDRELDQRCKQ